MQLKLDFQVIPSECPKCLSLHPVIRGSVYDDDTPLGIYLISLHGQYKGGRSAQLAIAIVNNLESTPRPIAVALNTLETKEQIKFQVTDWSESIFSSETYLGEMLDRSTALASSHIDLFFHIAEHIIEDLPDVKAYFSGSKIKQHSHPIWQEKANFLIKAKIYDSDNRLGGQEYIWSQMISESTFEICCIPFFVHDLSLGDVVETDKEYWFTRVTKPSGHYTFRVWFGDSKSETIRDEIIEQLIKKEFLFEWFSHNLLAIDFPNEPLAAEFSGYLFEKKTLNELDYETGKK